jgi:HSP20 family protein
MTMELMSRPQEAGIGGLRDAIDGLFEGFLGPRAAVARAYEGPWAPAVDIRETEDEITMHVDLPGLEKQDVQVEVKDNTLVVAGQRKAAKEDGWLRCETPRGAFYRAFSLPAEIQAAKVRAAMVNGVLELHLPKAEQAKPHKVEIA